MHNLIKGYKRATQLQYITYFEHNNKEHFDDSPLVE